MKIIKKLYGPQEFIIYTRQYDATIKIGEPRQVSGEYNDSTMVKKIVEGKISEIMDEVKLVDCNYIVLYKSVKSDINLENYGFYVFGENDTYLLYKMN